MDINLEYKNPCIVSFNFDGKDILNLINDNIDNMKASDNGYDFDFDESKRVQLPLDKKGHEIIEPLKQCIHTSKENIIETLIDNSNTYEWIKNRSKAIAEELYVYLIPYLYQPGFLMHPHIDNKATAAAGYLNLDDNEAVTSFHRTHDGDPIYTCSGEKNKGYIWLNTKDSYHSVRMISRPRKIVIINLVWVQI